SRHTLFTQKTRTETQAASYENLRAVRREFFKQGQAQEVLQHPLLSGVAKFNRWIAEARAKHIKRMTGRKNPACSERMKANNPMRNPETRHKMIASNKGRTFLARGGNGQLTMQQKALRDATGLPVEFVITTGPVKHLFPSLPNHYKVDLADPLRKLAIEIDGKTHKLKKWKFFDKRKTAVRDAL